MTMKSGNCILCQNPAQLCESHIIPESFYTKLYHQGKMVGITGVGNRKKLLYKKGCAIIFFAKDAKLYEIMT